MGIISNFWVPTSKEWLTHFSSDIAVKKHLVTNSVECGGKTHVPHLFSALTQGRNSLGSAEERSVSVLCPLLSANSHTGRFPAKTESS